MTLSFQQIKESAVKPFKGLTRVFPHLKIEAALLAAVMLGAGIGNTIQQTANMVPFYDTSAQMQQEEQSEQIESIFAMTESEKKEPEVQTVIQYRESQLCLIGDSRTYGIQTSVETEASIIAKSSMGLNWFKETAAPKFAEISDDIRVCIVLLGINDIFHADEYVETLNQFALEYPDKKMVYVNLGPVDPSLYTGIPNSSLEKFNKTLEDGLSDRWQVLDLYGYLTETGFESYDGLHYGTSESKRIFEWIVSQVSSQTITVIPGDADTKS